MLMQGGHHPKLTKQWYLNLLLAHVKNKFPVQHPGFQPERVIHFRDVFNEPLEKNHRRLQSRRSRLDSRRRRGNSGGPRPPAHRAAQGDEQRLLEVMDVAHRLGLYSQRDDDVSAMSRRLKTASSISNACARSRKFP